MRLFSTDRIAIPPTNLPDKHPADPVAHPACRLGQYVAGRAVRGQQGLADWLNAGQHRLGFRLRNALVLLTGLLFLLYFLHLLIQ